MSVSLLSTKLHIPPIRSGLVSRARLLDRLNEGVKSKLTLISAPAGFGKTTLISEWISSIGKPVAWLSLEKEDNDPERFWSYFIAALRTIQPDLGNQIVGSQLADQNFHFNSILIALINEIAALSDPLLLVLDDYHVIDSAPVQEGMIFLLEHMPGQLHLVIASRVDPAWPLAHWRTRGQLAEIRAADLRFTSLEAADFLNQTMKLDLSAQDIGALEERTEGWIAGLQMAALSLQGREDSKEFIEAFTGSNRYIFDYLVEEVFGRQPMEVRNFLLKTSVLTRLSAPLCDAMLQRSDSQEMLHRLEKANLFLVPLDDARHWYRYHHLFSELLHRRLEQTEPDGIDELHRRASQWYAANNLLSEAIRHALEAMDFLLLSEYTSANVLGVVENTELLDVLRHFEKLSDQKIVENPWLGVPYALVKAFVNPSGDVERILQRSEQGLANLEDASFRQLLVSLLDGIRAYLAWVKGDADQSLRFVHRAMDNLPGSDQTTLAQLLNLEGVAYKLQLKLPEAIRAYEAALLAGQSLTGLFPAMMDCNLVTAQFLHGKLRQTFAKCQNVLSLANSSDQNTIGSHLYNELYATMSLVLLEWNDLESAVRFARDGVAMSERWHEAESWQYTLSCLSRALCAAGNLEEAFAINQHAMQLALRISPYHYRLSACDEIWLNLAKGDIPKAVQRCVEIEPLMNDDEKRGQFLLVKACILYAQGSYAEILSSLEERMHELEQGEAYWYLINLMAIQALALQALGRQEDSLNILGHCLDLAEPEGYVRTFVERGTPMVKLLQIALKQGVKPRYINELLSAFDLSLDSSKSETTTSRFARVYLIDPLSDRELEILRFLNTNLSTPEIASEMILAPSTVRTHVKNVYAKLGAHGRIEAIQKAKALNLI